METSLHWCSFKHFLQADAFPSLLVHNLVWGWVTLLLGAFPNTVDIKSLKLYFGFKSTWSTVGNVKTGRPRPAAPAQSQSRQSYQYLRLLSPSDMLFIVKSVTSLDLSLVHLHLKIHLSLWDSVKCIVSSEEPERLWRWPWDCTGSYFSLRVKARRFDGSGDHGVCVYVFACACVCVCVCGQWSLGGGRVENQRRCGES